jgi:hypothetical protein
VLSAGIPVCVLVGSASHVWPWFGVTVQLNHGPVVKELVKGLDFPSRGWSFKKTAIRAHGCASWFCQSRLFDVVHTCAVAEERRVKLNDYLRVCSSLSVVATHPSFVAFIRPRGVPGDKVRFSTRSFEPPSLNRYL